MAIPEVPLIIHLRKQFAVVRVMLDFDRGNLFTVHWCHWKTGEAENLVLEHRGVVIQSFMDYITGLIEDGWVQV